MNDPSSQSLPGFPKQDLPKQNLEDWLASRLLPLPQAGVAIATLAPRLRPASVLVPIVARADAPTVLLTVRSKTLSKHAGQIAFPGGQVDPGDADVVATALRETWEETGITREFITPVGTLEPVESITGFLMFPIVAVVDGRFTATPSPSEVASIFEVPLAFVTDATNQIRKSGTFAGRSRDYYSIPYDAYDIWGATARILVDLGRRLWGE